MLAWLTASPFRWRGKDLSEVEAEGEPQVPAWLSMAICICSASKRQALKGGMII